MTGQSGLSVGPVVDAYDFTRFGTIVDVAGGHGRLLAAILASAPDAQGVLYDLPEVIAGAPALLRESHVAERVRLAEGSFFDGVPAGGDAYVLKHIIHDWDDDASVRILRNVRSAAAAGAALLLVETVIPEDDSGSIAKWTDMEMLIINNGRGTAGEYRRLFDEAGFQMIGVVDTASRFSIIEGRAAQPRRNRSRSCGSFSHHNPDDGSAVSLSAASAASSSASTSIACAFSSRDSARINTSTNGNPTTSPRIHSTPAPIV